MSTFVELQKQVQEYISDTSTTTLIAIKNEINDAIEEILNRALWKFTIRQTTVTTSSGVSDYYMPSDFGRTISLTQREDDIQMEKIWIADFDKAVPDPTAFSNGHPRYYMELLDDRVLAQPTTTSSVTLVSDNNSDLSQIATIWGVANGVDRREIVTLSAQNFVSCNGLYSKLYAITLNLSCVGTVAAYEKSVGTNLIKLYPGEVEREYKKFKVYPIPDGTYTLYLTYQAQAQKLINDSDVPIIPSRYHNFISDLVIGRRLMKQGDAKATQFLQSGETGIERMLRSEDYEWDYAPVIKPGVAVPWVRADSPYNLR